MAVDEISIDIVVDGLGNPFLRDPDQIQQDLIDGVTFSTTAQLSNSMAPYCVLAARPKSMPAHNALRSAIVPSANVDLQSLPTDTAHEGIRCSDGNLACAHCEKPLASSDANWAAATHSRERDLDDVLEAVETYTRRRERNPVTLREHDCPACAAFLSVQVNLQQESTPVYHLSN